MPPFCVPRTFNFHPNPADSVQVLQDSTPKQGNLSFSPLPTLESEPLPTGNVAAAILSGRPLLDETWGIIEDEREVEEASIDDQLHAWAHRGPLWILGAALPLDGENPWDSAPSFS